jgi:predicted transcriptional regulator
MKEEVLKLLIEIKRKRILQVDLVKLAKIASESRLSRILNGRVDPTKSELSAIKKALSLKVGGQND